MAGAIRDVELISIFKGKGQQSQPTDFIATSFLETNLKHRSFISNSSYVVVVL